MSKEKGFLDIGKRLHSVRGETDQRTFSRRVNVSQQAISNYERGNLPASWGFLRRLVDDFNVNLNWLFTGRGQRDYRSGSPYASLADNRAPGWPHDFLEQVALEDTDPFDLLIDLYFLYLATEPADAKSRLMADLQAIVEVMRGKLYAAPESDERAALLMTYDALARDDRGAAVEALIAVGEELEARDQGRAMPRARRAYLAALGIARLQGWVELEVKAARRAARTYRKDGRWDDAERLFRLALDACAAAEALPEEGGLPAPAPGPVSEEDRARTLLGYAHVAKHRGDLTSARERYLEALRWALRSRDPGLRAEVYLDLACLSYHERDWAKALEFVQAGRGFAEEARDERTRKYLDLAEALVRRELGEGGRAETILRALLRRADAERDASVYVVASGNLAEVLVDRGATAEAAELLERAAKAAEEHGDPRSLALRKLLLARIAAADGHDGAARAHLVDCLRYARDHGLTREFERAAAAVGMPEGQLERPLASKAG